MQVDLDPQHIQTMISSMDKEIRFMEEQIKKLTQQLGQIETRRQNLLASRTKLSESVKEKEKPPKKEEPKKAPEPAPPAENPEGKKKEEVTT